MPESHIDPQQFGAIQSDVEHLKKSVDDLDHKIDRHNSRMYGKLDAIIQGQHSSPCSAVEAIVIPETHDTPCPGLMMLQTQGKSIWKTLTIVAVIVMGVVTFVGGVVALIGALA